MSVAAPPHELVRSAPLLHDDETVADAVTTLIESGLPALAVVDREGRLRGIFGERELITALFPGYLGEIRHAGFLRHSLDAAFKRRLACAAEPLMRYLNREHVDVAPDVSDVQLAEMFLHHRVLVVPVVEDRRVVGLVTRADFFRHVADRLPRAR
jgi:CBS domain-containing protein